MDTPEMHRIDGEGSIPSAKSTPSFSRLFQRLHADIRTRSACVMGASADRDPASLPPKIRREQLKPALHDAIAVFIGAIWKCMREEIAEKDAQYGNLGLGYMQSESQMGKLLVTDAAVLRRNIKELELDDAIRILKRQTGDAFSYMGRAYVAAANVHVETVSPEKLEPEEAAFQRYKHLQEQFSDQTPAHERLLRGIGTANYVGWEMARIATYLARGQKTKAEVRTILSDSESFVKTLASMHVGVFTLLENILVKGLSSPTNREFHEHYFTLRTVNGKEMIGFSDSGLETLDRRIRINSDNAAVCVRTGCPAMAAHGEKDDVLSEHYHWILDVFERFCPDRHFAHTL